MHKIRVQRSFQGFKTENKETFAGVIHVRAELNVVKSQKDLNLTSEHNFQKNTASQANIQAENRQGFSLQLSNHNICIASRVENNYFPIIEPITNEIDRPLWSVMIPTYNGTEYLEKTLRSVLEQDPGSDLMQIEVVDDCSTQDEPEELVREIGQGRVSFYRQPKNLGLMVIGMTVLNALVVIGFIYYIRMMWLSSGFIGVCKWLLRKNPRSEQHFVDTSTWMRRDVNKLCRH
jgi:hypothetical protein